MSPKTLSPLKKAWYNWKALRLPWRKRFLVGLDLQGNKYWEFRDTIYSHKYRMRRIVQYPNATHYSEVKITPQWHQWLRHTRSTPPTLIEQTQDLVRQENLKLLAAQADARWAAKPSFLDAPEYLRGNTSPSLWTANLNRNLDMTTGETFGVRENKRKDMSQALPTETRSKSQVDGVQISDIFERQSNETAIEEEDKTTFSKKDKHPWKPSRAGPSEDWQPGRPYSHTKYLFPTYASSRARELL